MRFGRRFYVDKLLHNPRNIIKLCLGKQNSSTIRSFLAILKFQDSRKPAAIPRASWPLEEKGVPFSNLRCWLVDKGILLKPVGGIAGERPWFQRHPLDRSKILLCQVVSFKHLKALTSKEMILNECIIVMLGWISWNLEINYLEDIQRLTWWGVAIQIDERTTWNMKCSFSMSHQHDLKRCTESSNAHVQSRVFHF